MDKTNTLIKSWKNKLNEIIKTDPIPFDANLISTTYKAILNSRYFLNAVEKENYLEKYLLKHKNQFLSHNDNNITNQTQKKEFIMSLVILTNLKNRKPDGIWNIFKNNNGYFSDELFDLINMAFIEFYFLIKSQCNGDISNQLKKRNKEKKEEKRENEFISVQEENSLLEFIVSIFDSLEMEPIKSAAMKYVSISLWENVNPERIEVYLIKYPQFREEWSRYFETKSSGDVNKLNGDEKQSEFNLLFLLLNVFFDRLYKFDIKSDSNEKLILNLELILELFTNLLSRLSTRRYLRFLLKDNHFVTACRLSHFYRYCEDNDSVSTFPKLLFNLEHYIDFEIDDDTEEMLTDKELETEHNIEVALLQRISFEHFGESLKMISMSTISEIENGENLEKMLSGIKTETLKSLCVKLRLIPLSCENISSLFENEKKFLIAAFVEKFSKRKKSIVKQINSLAIYPTEKLLWDTNFLATANSIKGEFSPCKVKHRYALQKLDINFLTLRDYLSRNFQLYRLESSYQIREEISNAVFRLDPKAKIDKITGEKSTVFKGYSRMAAPIKSLTMSKIGRPKLGETKPSQVKIEVEVELSPFLNTKNRVVYKEWNALKEHDVLFLCTVDAVYKEENQSEAAKNPAAKSLGIKFLRGCELVEVRDQNYNLVGTRDERGIISEAKGTLRTFVVEMDCAQFEEDLLGGNESLYKKFNLIVRRKPKQNNFKAVLSTIRDIMKMEVPVSMWIQNLFLGNNNNKTGSKNSFLCDSKTTITDLKDTFVDKAHFLECFNDFEIKWNVPEDKDKGMYGVTVDEEKKEVEVFASECGKRNNLLCFTKMQAKAIREGCKEGLTLVVGPPGSGKTDCAVQIVNNLYRNHPGERILIVTHSNSALNDIFEKILNNGTINEKYLLRLGYGHKDLETVQNFSRRGRINHILKQRQTLLDEIGRLFKSLGLGDGTGFTCENATYLFSYHIIPKWNSFVENFKKLQKSKKSQNLKKIEGFKSSEIEPEQREKKRVKEGKGSANGNFVKDEFPFSKFFGCESDDAIADFDEFFNKSDEENFNKALELYKKLEFIYNALEELIAVEALRTVKERGDFLVASFSKVVAMTCTHAALNWHYLKKLGFSYQSLVMEEAAQALDLETFIPLTLQKIQNKCNFEKCKNAFPKRLVLVGDHHQLPPVVHSQTLRKQSRLDQSFFARLVRLGHKTITLDLQGRSRPEISALFTWRYAALGDLPGTAKLCKGNPALLYPFQFVDVPVVDGVGETAPTPHFYQNLREAEFAVALYMFMRLKGYPSDKITLLASYNGQRQLLRDVLFRHCEGGRNGQLFGFPAKVSTVDKFQGRQNDFVILSLVRTKSAGHLRDLRRMVVALSRARRGLYVFGNRALLEKVYELREGTERLFGNGDSLCLVNGEAFGNEIGAEWSEERKRRSFIVRNLEEMKRVVDNEAALNIK